METTIPFAGFYNSWHDRELTDTLKQTFSDSQDEPYSKELLERAYCKMNWSDAYNQYAKEFAEEFSRRFGIKLKYKLLQSPREYNFTTDRIFCEITITEVRRIFKAVDKDALNREIKAKFTSRDGFISFYSNSLKAWPKDLREWDHNQIGTLISAFILGHENWSDEWEVYTMESLTERSVPYMAINDNLEDDRCWKLLNYLYERSERTA